MAGYCFLALYGNIAVANIHPNPPAGSAQVKPAILKMFLYVKYELIQVKPSFDRKTFKIIKEIDYNHTRYVPSFEGDNPVLKWENDLESKIIYATSMDDGKKIHILFYLEPSQPGNTIGSIQYFVVLPEGGDTAQVFDAGDFFKAEHLKAKIQTFLDRNRR